ncbi:MAG: hypothetical protein A2Y40_10965 [Candidatus Margulisbacteria bacterium GWF2_35_9]|nr:MAG: hypothetical protein A2Y40_10965 [Candidatus Margulisbacteria bacterium GWF2_35_9]
MFNLLSNHSLDIVFYLYFITAVLLVNFEIVSSTWKNWFIFNIKLGVVGYIFAHILIITILLVGLINVYEISFVGIVISILLIFMCISEYIINIKKFPKKSSDINTNILRYLLISLFIISIMLMTAIGYIIINYITYGEI